jgi:hypothetical protein
MGWCSTIRQVEILKCYGASSAEVHKVALSAGRHSVASSGEQGMLDPASSTSTSTCPKVNFQTHSALRRSGTSLPQCATPMWQARANPNISFEPIGNRALSLCDHWMLGSLGSLGSWQGSRKQNHNSPMNHQLAGNSRFIVPMVAWTVCGDDLIPSGNQQPTLGVTHDISW